MYELKPCPFCGRAPVLTTYAEDDPAWSQALIKCDHCGACCHKAHRSKDQAIVWWNSRALDPVDTHLVKNLGKWAMSNEKSKINWDTIDDAFGKFLESFQDVDGERYERSAAMNGGERMKHLIRQAMKTPNTDFNLKEGPSERLSIR